MKVYLVQDIEEELTCGIFTTEEKAHKAIEVMKQADDEENRFTMEEWKDFFMIEEIELDKMYNVVI